MSTEPLDALIDAGHSGLAGRVAAAVVHGRRSPVTAEERTAIETYVPAGVVRFFRDGDTTWLEAND